MERGVGQHDPVILIARGHRGGDETGLTFFEEDNRAFPGDQHRFLFGFNPGECFYPVQIRAHQGQGFLLPVLSLPQAPDRLFLNGLHGQMKSSQAFDGHDPALPKQAGGFGDGILTVDGRPVSSMRATRGPQVQQALGWA